MYRGVAAQVWHPTLIIRAFIIIIRMDNVTRDFWGRRPRCRWGLRGRRRTGRRGGGGHSENQGCGCGFFMKDTSADVLFYKRLCFVFVDLITEERHPNKNQAGAGRAADRERQAAAEERTAGQRATAARLRSQERPGTPLHTPGAAHSSPLATGDPRQHVAAICTHVFCLSALPQNSRSAQGPRSAF